MAFPPIANDMMPISDLSTFDMPCLFFGAAATMAKATTPYNLITLLAAVQELGIPILPITWQPKRQLLGRGGTSQVNQALLNLHTRFAFKRVSGKDKLGTPEEEVFRRFINEIAVLWHPSVRSHSNILELQGICWDVPLGEDWNHTEVTSSNPSNIDKVWPVLVFQGSPFCDLYQFAAGEIGRELSISDRLRICLDIGKALAHMQSICIIHGDIKPHNIIIFRGDDGSFTAKITDFGFSTRYLHDDDHIMLPESWPWYAPECREYPGFSPQQALITDVFSFGMLCLWFIFEKYLSGVLQLPGAVQSERTSYNCETKHRSLEFLDDLKKRRYLTQFAGQLVMAETSLDAETRRMLECFFNGCLECDPQSRDINIQYSLNHMNIHQSQPFIQVAVPKIFSPTYHGFRLCNSLFSLYLSDYRLRSYILRQLEGIVIDDPTSSLSTQLAICYKLGFGFPYNDYRLKSFTYNSEETKFQLEEVINLEPSEEHMYGDSLYGSLRVLGHHSPLIQSDYYREQNILDRAESIIRAEAELAKNVLGAKHRALLYLRFVLGSIADLQGRWKENDKLNTEIVDTCQTVMGREHPDTLYSMLNLATTYRNQNRLKEAEDLGVEVSNISQKGFGREHYYTQASMENLASTYRNQGRWYDSERLQQEVIDIRQRTLGKDHPNTLVSMGNLALTYRYQGRWEEAEILDTEVEEISRRTQGEDNPTTLALMANLASTFRNQGRLKEAESYGIEVVDIMQRIFGQTHPNTLTCKSNLALIYWSQCRWEEAEQLGSEVMDIRQKMLGQEHPDTLTSMHNLALTWGAQGRLGDAKKLMTSCVNLCTKVHGPKHPNTLYSIEALVEWGSID